MRFLQKLGKALMLPVAVLPVCGLLMGIGYFLCPASIQGGEVHGFLNTLGLYLVKAGSAAIDNIAWLFAVGVGIGMSEDNDGTGAVASLLSWLTIITLLNSDFVVRLTPYIAENVNSRLAFEKIANPFIGILSGLIGSQCYNRFKSTRLPDWLSFFSGKRCVAIIAALVSIAVSLVLLFAWPVLYGGLVAMGKGIAGMGDFGAGIYVFLNRLLIPMGLHHALNNVFWFDTVGLGDLTHFWAGETTKDVGWSLGMYMSGFFPCMMFGVPGAALAMIHCAKPGKKKAALGILLSAAVCSFVCGVTEPFEFAFMFAAPLLYVVYSALYGIFAYIACIIGFRAGFSFSGGVTDLIFSSSLPAAAKTWLIIPLGLAAFAVFYTVFRFAITKWDLQTPGRYEETGAVPEADEEPACGGADGAQTGHGVNDAQANEVIVRDAVKNSRSVRTFIWESDEDEPSEPEPINEEPVNDDKYMNMAVGILQGLGGVGNLISIDNCITRLRLEVKNSALVNEAIIKNAGARAVLRTGRNCVQVVIGTEVQFVAEAFGELLRPKG